MSNFTTWRAHIRHLNPSFYSNSRTRNKQEEEQRNEFLDVHNIPRDSWCWYKPANCLIVGTNNAVETKIANAYFI